LGGNRKGARRTISALFLTMLLGGLWHGAAWHFVAWGALHGTFLVVERGLAARFGNAAWVKALPTRVSLGVLTFVLTCIAWVFFRSSDLPRAMMHIGAMLGEIPAAPILKSTAIAKVLFTIVVLIGTHIALKHRGLEDVVRRAPAALVGTAWALMLGLIVLTQGGGGGFIYFQF
jgi:alginate O-acetyltransferase complex protein AlgI